jgi:cytochrome c oxidase subunit 1
MAITEVRPAEPTGPHPAPRRGPQVLEWLTTIDHKRIGILYVVTAFALFLVGGVLAMLLRAELTEPGRQMFTESGYNQTFTMHGTIMLLLFAAQIGTGLGNYFVPLQIGAADVAFPRLNAVGYWFYLFGGLIVLSGFVTAGGAAANGWTSYAPLSLRQYSPEPGVDLWIVGLILVGVAAIVAAVNLLATIFTLRVPGMTMFRLPMFTWGIASQQLLVLFAFPSITAALFLLFLERNFGGIYFDPQRGGVPLLWQHMFWFFGHPEVYIVIMPAFGIISEVIPVFSRKPLFGYRAMVFAFFGILSLSFAVWAHHMFVTAAVSLVWFSILSFMIAVPTGIKVFNWLATMWGGSIKVNTAMLMAVGFITVFVIGGITGVFVASPPIDFSTNDTYYVVAHFHYVMVGGLLFALFAGIYYWYPKMTGRMLSERLGHWQFWPMFIGFNLTFFPQFLLGLEGMPRRIADYEPGLGWNGYNLASSIGSFLLGASILPFLWNVVVSRRRGAIAGDNPWGAYTLEWATTSPPPEHNFEELPPIRSERPVFDLEAAHVSAEGAVTDPERKWDRG